MQPHCILTTQMTANVNKRDDRPKAKVKELILKSALCLKNVYIHQLAMFLSFGTTQLVGLPGMQGRSASSHALSISA